MAGHLNASSRHGTTSHPSIMLTHIFSAQRICNNNTLGLCEIFCIIFKVLLCFNTTVEILLLRWFAPTQLGCELCIYFACKGHLVQGQVNAGLRHGP